MGTLLGNFRILEIFFFENFRRLDIPRKTGQKFFEKIAPKHVQNRFGYFWERFWAFLNFENFLIFKKIFEDSTLHGTPGVNFVRKNHLKTCLDTFGNTFGQFWNFENIFFLKIFEDSTFHGKLGKNFSKKLSKLQSKHVCILLGTILGVFGFLKFFFDFFENFLRFETPWKTGQKVFEKFAPKHVQNTFGYFWERFWAFLEFFKKKI